MKDSPDSAAVGRAVDSEVFANRKLIRPSFNRSERAPENGEGATASAASVATNASERPERQQRQEVSAARADPRGKFLLSEADAGQDPYGPGAAGWRADSRRHRVVRQVLPEAEPHGAANLLIYKPSIKYMYKESEIGGLSRCPLTKLPVLRRPFPVLVVGFPAAQFSDPRSPPSQFHVQKMCSQRRTPPGSYCTCKN